MKAKIKTDDEEQGGGAASTGVPTHTQMRDVDPLAIDQARALVAIARNGGGVANVILPDIVTAATASRMRERGLIETLPNMGSERARVKLTSFGVQRLIEAQKIVSAHSSMSR